MNQRKNFRNFAIALAITIFAFLAPATAVSASERVDLLFTGDMHSYMREYDEKINGQDMIVGGFSRIKTYIDSYKSEHPETLLVDCGDTVMGTLPQALMDSEAFELSFLADFGYDAVTIGNHEFDYGAQALSDMYSTAAAKNPEHPSLVCCNIDWSQTDEYTQTLKVGTTEYGITPYVIKERDGVKIAVTGVFGHDALKCAPTCMLTFTDPVESVKKTVETIKANENPDMIICLSHSGTDPLSDKDEDAVLAKGVPDLDVIVSGHSHVKVPSSLKIGNTYIVGAGCYGQNVGTAVFTKNSSGRWDVESYELKLMDQSIDKDQTVEEELDKIDEIIDERVLADYGLSAKQVIARNNGIEFETVDDIYELHDETMLGNILSDAYRYAANQTPEGQASFFAASVAPSGTIRSSIPKGEITVARAFEILSLGTGPDGKVGYPLVSVYLTGKEIKTMVEVDASISDMMKSARLYMSGVSFEFNPKRMLLNRTVDSWLSPAFLEQSRSEFEDDKLYHVVTDSYSMSMLGAVTELSKGLLSVVPKDMNGNEVTDYMDCIIYDRDGNELKAWKALCDYMMTFSKDENGISVIPEYYAAKQNRRVVNASYSPRAMFKNTSIFFIAIVAIVILIILLIAFIIRTVVRKKRGKKVFIEEKE